MAVICQVWNEDFAQTRGGICLRRWAELFIGFACIMQVYLWLSCGRGGIFRLRPAITEVEGWFE
jgi:hypothetical protein